ncbi:hypothetical protein [Methylobacterium aquaticum]|jgi:hypothetical protein|uniref:hypothetical protein n=1 Tax=Methylobacterium aquaticum TaxID=270351 RepID=UPI0009E61C47|nr:hypothetical protein [Methylobacterium aquaticum]
MIARVALLSSALFLGAVGSVQAQKLTLPVGEWGLQEGNGPNCNPPFLRIEQNRIVKRLGGGEGRCPITKIKKEGKYLMVNAKCKYDKSIPWEYLIEGDGDSDRFSLIVQTPTKILFNNTPHELCPSVSGAAR